MTTKLLSSVLCLAMLCACQNEPIAPTYERSVLQKPGPDASRSDGTARKRNDNSNSLTSSITGSIDDRSFTGDFTVRQFTESAGVLLAEGYLTNVKLTGKDHKYLEYILERETYLVPVTIDQKSTAAETFQIAATCTVLNFNFNGLTTNVLGLDVIIDPIAVTINANDDEVLGNLICTALDTLNSVVDLVGILNELLGLLSL